MVGGWLLIENPRGKPDEVYVHTLYSMVHTESTESLRRTLKEWRKRIIFFIKITLIAGASHSDMKSRSWENAVIVKLDTYHVSLYDPLSLMDGKINQSYHPARLIVRSQIT